MLAEILQSDFRGLTEIDVESFFTAYGLYGVSLRSGSSESLKTSTVDAIEDPFVNLQALRGDNDGGFAMARAFGDFSGDGLVDIFMAPGIWLSTDPVPAEVYAGDGAGNYLDSSIIFQDYQLGGLHPRKALVADFNADGVADVIIADHGYDAPPFPGASPLVWLSTPEGHERVDGLDEIIGFLHSVTVGDIDRDGDVDALFGAGDAFADPTEASKAVVISADIIGDASVWYLLNQTDVTSITADELTLVGTLENVNNIKLVGFDAFNFGAEAGAA